MKSLKSKLLSLLLAMAMVCSLVPTAWASNLPASREATLEITADKTEIQANTSNNVANLSVPDGSTGTWSIPQDTAAASLSSNGTTATLTASTSYSGSDTSVVVTFTPSDTSIQAVTKSITVKAPATSQPTIVVGLSTNLTNNTVASSSSISVTASVTSNGTAVQNPTITWTVTDSSNLLSSSAPYTGNPISLTAKSGLTTGGTVSVEANYNGTKKSINISVTPVSLGTATLAAEATSINVNGTTRLTITAPSGVTSWSSITWTVASGTGTATLQSTTTNYGDTSNGRTNVLTGATAGTVTVSAVLNGVNGTAQTVLTNSLPITIGSKPVTISLSPNKTTFSSLGEVIRATAVVDGATGNYYNYSYKWSTNPSYYVSGADYLDYNQYYVDLTAIAKGITTLTLTVTNPTTGATVGTDSVQLTVNSAADINVSGSVYGTSTSYGLTEITNTTNSYYGTSIYDQLVNAVRNLSGGARSLNHVIFNYKTATAGDLSATANYAYYVNGGYTNSATQTYGGLLSDVVFIPKTSGTAHFSFTAYDNTGKTYSGLMSITTDGTATGSGDINYAASIGDTQYFNAADFENLYYDKTNGGTLSYVTFSTPSSGTGTLYADGVRLTGVNSPCYLSPTRNQAALDSVYFTPSGSTATRAGTVRIGFTAYGNRGSSSSYYNRTITGTVVINYLNGTAKDLSLIHI